MNRAAELSYYTVVDKDFFEPLTRRVVDETDFIAPARAGLPSGWDVRRSGLWCHASPPDLRLPAQGWKIHVSSVPSAARIVLSIVAATLGASGTAFKFAADQRMLASINAKRWPRGGSGKFITVYPVDVADFRRIVDELYVALSGYAGPYVLSDRRYRDSHVIYYRFGGIDALYRIAAGGRREALLRGPDGTEEPDHRLAVFRLPTWVRDPFESPAAADAARGDGIHLGDGRFRVLRALTFSAAGGVYLADDLEAGRRVVIKEARPYIGGGDAAKSTLRKEYRLLRQLAPMDVAPHPVAFFHDWEHSFLAEAWLEGETLRDWLAKRYPWLKARATGEDVRAYLDEVCIVFTHFARALERVHAVGISVGDLSFHNCIVSVDGTVRLIDLEGAVEHGIDAPIAVRTPGFASARTANPDHAAACAEDRYAFGTNLLAAILPVNAILGLDANAAERFIRRMVDDMGYPACFVETILALLDTDATKRPSPMAAMERLRSGCHDTGGRAATLPYRLAVPVLRSDAVPGLLDYIEASATFGRADRCVPADPEVFETNALGVAHGVAGVLHAFDRTGRNPPASFLPYLYRGLAEGGARDASLMYGDAGIAWVLFDLGEHARAAALLAARRDDVAIRQRDDLHGGLAGWGMANLRAWKATHAPACLDAAIDAGEELMFRAVQGDATMHWLRDGVQAVGLAGGSAGIALFLLHLSLATGRQDVARAAADALRGDLVQARRNPDGDPTWPMAVGGATAFPYLRHGSAGILAVTARFLVATGAPEWRDTILRCEHDLLRHQAISPGLFDGLAGIGETLLDLARFLPERAALYLRHARRIAAGIEPFLIHRDGRLAVPGKELLRISCDFATGNAGVAAFLHRLEHGGQASFMLDECLPSWRPHTEEEALPA